MRVGLGKRIIKTSSAVFFSVLLSNIVHLEYPFFTAITAIFTIENTKDTPMIAGKIRILGSLIGSLVGIILAYIQPGNVILCGLGMAAIILLSYSLNLESAVPIAGVIFMAIMLGTNISNPLSYSISRILNTVVGIIIAVFVDYLIPTHSNENDYER